MNENDAVSFPSHYTNGDVESIDAIWASGHGVGFCVGNAQKYLYRAGKKGEETLVEDLKKAQWYVTFLLSKLDESVEDPRASREAPEEPDFTRGTILYASEYFDGYGVEGILEAYPDAIEVEGSFFAWGRRHFWVDGDHKWGGGYNRLSVEVDDVNREKSLKVKKT